MRHKILFFASGYKTSASANGICARNLVKEFVKQGHEVYVIAVPHDGETDMEEIDGAKVWFVEHDWMTRTLSYVRQNAQSCFGKLVYLIFSLFRAIMLAPLYPNTSRSRVNKLIKLSRNLVGTYGIDTVIGTCLPYCGIPAAVKLKEDFGDQLRIVTYHFDILSIPNNKKGIIYSFKKYRFAKAFEKEVLTVDRVFLPETARGLYNYENINYIGLPVYLPEKSDVDTHFEYTKEFKNLAYVGSIGGDNRSLVPVVKILKKMNHELNDKFMLHIWGNVDGITKNIIAQSSDIITYHGLLDNSQVHSVLMKSDFLLNISNSLLYRLLPSKMFSMFATGKPIINLVYHPDDCSIPFFEKYGNSLQIEMWNLEHDFQQIKNMKQINIDESLFDEYKPVVIADRLLMS